MSDMPPWGDLIGSLAALLTTISFIPQVWHTWRTRDVSGISLAMYSAFTLGVALWLVYGWLLGAGLPHRQTDAMGAARALVGQAAALGPDLNPGAYWPLCCTLAGARPKRSFITNMPSARLSVTALAMMMGHAPSSQP